MFSALLEISDETTALLEPWQPAASIVRGCWAEYLWLKTAGLPRGWHILCPVFSAGIGDLLHLECTGRHVYT